MRSALLLLVLLAPAASAGDAAPGLGDEPHYASKSPGYALVTFGSREQARTWVVLDDAVAYVDRDGDGKLTGADERIEAHADGDFVTDVAACDDDGRPLRHLLTLRPGRDGDGRRGLTLVHVSTVETVQVFHATTGFIPLGDRADRAPRIPIHGPLRFVLMDHWTSSIACRTLPNKGGPHEFSILVATPVHGIPGEAYVYPNLFHLQGETLPDVRCTFETNGASPHTFAPPMRTWLCDCARRYRASLTVPPAKDVKRATLSVSFPAWKHGVLPDATFDLPYDVPAK